MRSPRAEPKRVSTPRIRLAVLAGAVLLLVGGGATLGYHALRSSSVFAVHRVVVSGGSSTLRAQVETTVRTSIGSHSMLALSSSRVARAVETVPGVHVARVDRDFPSTLRVRVWPEHPVAIVVSGHDRAVVAANGRVLATIGRRSRPPSYPRVGLPGRGVPKPGTYIQNPKVLAQLSAAAAIPAHFGAAISWIKTDPDHGIYLQMHWPPLPIRLGPVDHLQQKMRAASLVLKAYPTTALREGLQYINVSAPAYPAAMPKEPDQSTLALAPTAGDASSSTTASTDTSTTPSTSTNP
jgi:cell division septal protein FtsQ